MPKPKDAETVTPIREESRARPLSDVLVTPLTDIQAAGERIITRVTGGAYEWDSRMRDQTVDAIEDVLVKVKHAFELAAVNEERVARRRSKQPRPKFRFD